MNARRLGIFGVLCAAACAATSVVELPPPVPVTFLDGGGDVHAACAGNDGGGCGREGIVCEIGKSASPECNGRARCVGGVWIDDPPAEAACAHSACGLDPEGLRGSICPAGVGIVCAFARTTCGCARVSDAGSSAPGNGVYQCVTTPAPCPYTRPPLGSACVTDITCDYGACMFEDGLRERCVGGAWQLVPTSCH